MATSGDHYLATSGDFFMATDTEEALALAAAARAREYDQWRSESRR